MTNGKVFAILINYAGLEDTLGCVESLKKQTYPNLEIIVVDNASPDGSGEILKEKLRDCCTVLLETENLGFSHGNNVGIRYALAHGADSLLFINNDTVQDPELVQKLYSAHNETTVTVPKTYYYSDPNVLWDTGSSASSWGRLYNRGLGEIDKGQYEREKNVDLFTGHCVLMHRNCIELAGMWDESYFMYVEDTEYALRLKSKGVAIRYVPDAKLWHKVSRSSGGNSNPKVVYYMIRNRLYLFKQHSVPRKWKIRNAAWILLNLVRYYVLGKEPFKYTLRAVQDYARNIKGRAMDI